MTQTRMSEASFQRERARSDVMDADTTAGAQLDYAGDPVALDCGMCGYWQIFSCFFEACSSEYAAWTVCEGSCEAESAALSTCLEASTTVQDCHSARLPQCLAL